MLNSQPLRAAAFTMLMLSPITAQAETPERCFDAGFYKDMLGKTASLGAEYRDTVNAIMLMKINMRDDAPFPERFTFRANGEDMDIPILADGTVPAANKIAALPAGEFCIMDSRIGEDGKGKVGMGVGLDADVLFLKSDGAHSLGELREGAKDGKAFYRKMYGAMASFVSLSHVMIDYEGEVAAPVITATQNGAPIDGLTTEDFYGTYLVSLKELKKLRADGLSIGGGAYTLSPVPNKKTLEKYFGK